MVQQLLISIKVAKQSPHKWVIISHLILFVGLFNFRLINKVELAQLENTLMQFSSLFSAIIITFIVTKVFQIRSERISNRNLIISLSNKLTDFRRIAHIMLHRNEFWPTGTKGRMDNTYKELSFDDLYDFWGRSKEKQELVEEYEKDKETVGGNLYLDLRYLEGNIHLPEALLLYEDRDKGLIYSTNDLEVLVGLHVGANLWYHLKNDWSNYQHDFNIASFRTKEKERICLLSSKIDKKFEGRDFDKNLLADIGSEMSEYYIPQLYELQLKNTKPLPSVVKYLLNQLRVVLVFGVLIPIFFSALNTSVLTTAVGIWSVISAIQSTLLIEVILRFILTFKKIVSEETEVFD